MAADAARSGDDGEPCTLRFASLRPGLTASVRWVDYEGVEKEYARLEEWCFFNQDTFVNHPWRLRDVATGQLLVEYCGPTATITLLPDGTTRVLEGLHRPPPVGVQDCRGRAPSWLSCNHGPETSCQPQMYRPRLPLCSRPCLVGFPPHFLACCVNQLHPQLQRVPPPDLRAKVQVTDPRWGTFRQRGAALSGDAHGGIPILAFDVVCQEAVDKAEDLIEHMLGGAPPEVVAAMVEAGAEVAIIGKDQATTDLPMYRHLRGVDCGNGGGDYDKATRGLGGNPGNPTTSCGEENLLMLDGDRYRYENILVHEFGHAVMDLGLHGHPLRDAIVEAFRAAPRRPERRRARSGKGGGSAAADGSAARDVDSAMASGEDGEEADEGWAGYDPACYMMANECEYWAEGSQAWFDATVREDVTSGVNSRERVKQRDPLLAAILEQVYGDSDWRYPATAPRPFPREAASAKRPRTGAAPAGGAAAEVEAEAAAGAGGTTSGGGSRGSLQVQDNPLQPLLPEGAGPSSSGTTARRGARWRGSSPARLRGSGAGGGSSKGRLTALPGRATRALARLMGCCLCLPV
ncbi:hypothetical protein ABPG75_007449 [Micractinium tetrahymenae]